MKPPPLLLGAALLFWGWQSGFLVVGAIMALVLEGSRFIKTRWEFSDEDFSRIWLFCSLLFLAAAVYSFTANQGPSSFGAFFENPNYSSQRSASNATASSAASLFRWLPMILFPFVAAQAFSTREAIPLATISLILSRRWKKAKKTGTPTDPRHVHIGHPYLLICLFTASVHTAENTTFFWGLSVLLAWTLWAQRSRRFGIVIWAAAFATVIVLGYSGQHGLGLLQHYLDNLNPQWLSGMGQRGFDPAQSRTSLGKIGQMKGSGKIVIRLKPKEGSQPPAYLRETSYRAYRATVWSAGAEKNDFDNIPEMPANSGNWYLIADKTNTATANIACYLGGGKALLPLPEGSGRLQNLPAYILSKNLNGAVLAEGPGLVIFDALFGPGQSIDAPADEDADISVPVSEQPALAKVVSDFNLQKKTDAATLAAVSHYFTANFNYSLWQGADLSSKTNDTPLSRFLLKTHSGHCE